MSTEPREYEHPSDLVRVVVASGAMLVIDGQRHRSGEAVLLTRREADRFIRRGSARWP